MFNRIIFSTLLLLVLSGCQSTTVNSKIVSNQEDQKSQCDNVKELINSHKNGFKKYKTKKKSIAIADLWEVNFNLIGESCQVVRWKKDKYSYKCILSSPNQAVALERFNNAKKKIEVCLGENWQLHQLEAQNNNNMIAIYTNKNNNTTVATHALAVDGIFRDEWTNYIFVGDSERLKMD